MGISSKARVLLINPPHIQSRGKFARSCFEPIGLSYVAAYLEQSGYDVVILDAIAESFDQYNYFDETRETVGLSYDQIRERVIEADPKFVGIGAPFTVRAEAIYKCTEVVKEAKPEAITFLGGIHVSTYAEEVISKPGVDFIIQGEGEFVSARLLDALLGISDENPYDIPNLGYKRDGDIVIKARTKGIDDLDALPFPARHLLPVYRYFEASAKRRSGRTGHKALSVVTSRGCPFECTFCTTHDMMGRTYRYRSPENVVAELRHLVDAYGVEQIHFEDDQLTIRKDRFERLCELIVENEISIKWDTPNGVLASPIAEERIIKKMKLAGCEHICVAPESGDQYVVDKIIKKRQKLTKVNYVIEHAVKHGIKVDAFFVIGSIGETKRQIRNTINYAKRIRKMGVRWCHFHVATPFDSTPLYQLAESHGYLIDQKKSELEFLGEKRVQTEDFTIEEVDELYLEAMRVNPVFEFMKISEVWKMFVQEPMKVSQAILRFLMLKSPNLSQ